MNDHVMIRPATLGDLARIIPVWRQLIDYHRPLNPLYTRRPDAEERWRGFAAGRITDADSLLLVAETGDQIVGYLLALIEPYPPVFVAEKRGIIYDLAVADGWRGGGIGSRLVDRCLDWFRAEGEERFEVRMVAANEGAVRFWSRMGFAPQTVIGEWKGGR